VVASKRARQLGRTRGVVAHCDAPGARRHDGTSRRQTRADRRGGAQTTHTQQSSHTATARQHCAAAGHTGSATRTHHGDCGGAASVAIAPDPKYLTCTGDSAPLSQRARRRRHRVHQRLRYITHAFAHYATTRLRDLDPNEVANGRATYRASVRLYPERLRAVATETQVSACPAAKASKQATNQCY
jgi:hypothetical protein